MKIIIAANKTLPRNGKQELDTGMSYLYQPLTELGHEVYFYDTIKPAEPDFDLVTQIFLPDLVFCCFTGNSFMTPYEPWPSILRLTKTTKITTFNWFCDDTWRFDNFSSKACWSFDHCSTPEPSFVSRFKDIGYENIHLANWHANSDCYSTMLKDIDISFAGDITLARKQFFSTCKVPIVNSGGLSIDELFNFYCRSRIGVNLSVNVNDPEKKTQMKQRVFELAAAGCLVLSEYTPGIEDFFELDKEIVTFSGVEEFEKKVTYLLENPDVVEKVATAGHERFLKDHESKVRLKTLLEKII